MPKRFTQPGLPPDQSFQRWRSPERVPWDDSGHDHVDGATTWGVAVTGPEPHPSWVETSLDAIDEDLGPLKEGKEAVCHLVRRAVPGTDGCLMVAKRYRVHGGFTRDAAYREGRRVRESREQRALDRRTRFGRGLAAGQWAAAEFGALCQMFAAGVSVPYPVQLHGSELMMQLLGDVVVAPRLVDARPTSAELRPLLDGLLEDLFRLSEIGLVHGDLSPYNLLVWQDRLWLIDVPQAVPIATNPHAFDFLRRDVDNIAAWFTRKGVRIDIENVYSGLVVAALAS